MRPVPCTALNGGINRLRVKGGVRADQLYDLVNGYLTQDGGAQVREGTIRNAALTSLTKGLCAIRGVFNVFATSLQTVPGGYNCNVLVHPTNPAATLVKIWFAKPFMGFPYVAAEFSTGEVLHYWLQSDGTWAANHVYTNGAIVTPTTPNGLAFQAQRTMAPNPVWTAQRNVALNDVVEPTTYNGYAFKATAVAGASPHTGSTEPSWPAVEAATVQEFGDFSTSSSTADTTGSDTTGQPLGTTITDRYGNSATVSNSNTGSDGSGVSVPADSTVSTWAPGTTYARGAVVRPSTSQGAFINAIPNGDFEAGNDGSWVLGSDWSFQTSNQFQGNFCVRWNGNHSNSRITMFNFGTVTPGQSVTVTGYLNPNNGGANLSMALLLRWYDASDTFISETPDVSNSANWQQGGGYRLVSSTGTAPANAAHVRVAIWSSSGTSPNPSYADLISWNLEQPAAVSNFLFEAIQATAASSASIEPTWPTVSGNTVVDGGVTWKAIGTSIITWTAVPIMKSGAAEPTWPTTIGVSVTDGGMAWVCVNRQVPAPNSKAVALGASHVWAGDNDIVPYCAAVNPTDWTSANNAGYLPTGLNNYGDNPVAVLALYRSNLAVFNSSGYQLWQIDADPANNALLDAQPIGSVYQRAAQSVANDLLFLSEVGVRNIGTVGATANLQIGGTGQPVDPLVKAALKAGTYDPLSLYFPGRGQYWLIFGPQVFVLTQNGANRKTWSRYVFPDAITDWCLNGTKLYLRSAGNLVWQLDEATLVDDFGGANVVFKGAMQWPYVSGGSLGVTKMLIGADLVGNGSLTIQIGFREDDPTAYYDNAGFATSLNVTAPYALASADIVPGTPVPIPLSSPSYSLILVFDGNQAWSWDSANIYVSDTPINTAGATG